MTHLTGDERTHFVRKMFSRISKTYDLMNRLMTFGQDLKWRREAVKLLNSENIRLVLDLGAGTGDMTQEILQQSPATYVIGVDLTPEMLKYARNRKGCENANWVIADVHHLPFLANTFSATISGFLLRNLSNPDPVLVEQHRVLQDNAIIVCLETSPIRQGLLGPMIRFYIHRVIPMLGNLLSKDPEAYAYLALSTSEFIPAEELAHKMAIIGFQEVRYLRRMFGTIAIHHAQKR